MKLIVGLGNPGHKYEFTRHNIGFMAIDNYAKNNNIIIDKQKFDGLFVKTNINGNDIILLKPLKYMNLSGEVIKKFIDFYKINIEDILIISDDLDMKIGKIKLKAKGSSGGHNGLKNIENHLKTQEYKRLKIGISNNKNIETKEYVLSKFTGEDLRIVQETINKTVNILNDFLYQSFDILMSKYNHN